MKVPYLKLNLAFLKIRSFYYNTIVHCIKCGSLSCIDTSSNSVYVRVTFASFKSVKSGARSQICYLIDTLSPLHFPSFAQNHVSGIRMLSLHCILFRIWLQQLSFCPGKKSWLSVKWNSNHSCPKFNWSFLKCHLRQYLGQADIILVQTNIIFGHLNLVNFLPDRTSSIDYNLLQGMFSRKQLIIDYTSLSFVIHYNR